MVWVKYIACLIALVLCAASLVKQRRLDLSAITVGLVAAVVLAS